MYRPPHFEVTERARLHAVIRAHPLGLLISAGTEGPRADAIPFQLVEAEGGDLLRCHVARANPQWRAVAAGAEVLVVFQGVDAYVTPSWYAAKREHGKVVPTWNYVIVQARGQARIDESEAFLSAQIAALTEAHEGQRAEPWAVSDAPAAFVAAQMRGIVGIEIAVTSLVGKFKASQNRPEADRAGVVAGLGAEAGENAAAMARLVATGGRDGR